MSRRVIVIGGGVVGLSAAYHLAERGHTVTVLDGRPATASCSFGNSGLLVPSHFIPLAAPGMVGLGLRSLLRRDSPFALAPRLDLALLAWLGRFWRAADAETVALRAPVLAALHLASREIHRDWAARFSPGFGLKTDGLLMLASTAHGLAEEVQGAATARSLGIPAEVLGPGDLARFEPDLRLAVAGGVFYPLDAHLSPADLLVALEAAVVRRGAEIDRDAAVTGCRREGRRLVAVQTARRDHAADAVVLAAGVASTVFARDLGLKLPMLPGKGYSLTVPAPGRLPRLPSILTEARVAVTPIGTSIRVGGTLELGRGEGPPDPRRVAGILRSFTTHYPDFAPADFAEITPWSGLRPCSPDGLPYIGRFARFDNLVAATGHAMMGVSLGPITGRLVAEIVSGEPPSLEISALHPDRFS